MAVYDANIGSEPSQMFSHGVANDYTDENGPITKASPISDAYSDLEKSIAFASNMAENLEGRLSGVLGPSRAELTQQSPNQGADPKPSISPMAESIRSDAKRINLLALHLQNILNRIEL